MKIRERNRIELAATVFLILNLLWFLYYIYFFYVGNYGISHDAQIDYNKEENSAGLFWFIGVIVLDLIIGIFFLIKVGKDKRALRIWLKLFLFVYSLPFILFYGFQLFIYLVFTFGDGKIGG